MRVKALPRCRSVLLAAIMAGASAVPAPSSTHAGRAQPLTAACAWPGATNAVTLGENKGNVSNPDSATDYWIMLFTVQDDLRIMLSGRYPDSRYMSFAVYDAQGAPFTTNGVGSTLPDYRIAPDPGSVNPWQHPAPPGGAYTVTLRSDVAPGQANTLPLAPAGTRAGTPGVIFFRVYAPAQADPARIPLPVLTLTRHGVSRRLPACPASSQDVVPASWCSIPFVAREDPMCAARSGSPSATSRPRPTATPTSGTRYGIAQFVRSRPGSNTPDTDVAYLVGGFVLPPGGEVVIIRAKAPTTPAGAHPHPWPALGVDMRYWSLCIDLARPPVPVVLNHLPDGTVDYGCRYDSQVARDKDGYYTVVIGTEAQRAAIARIPGATFLPLSLAHPDAAHALFFRNMLANPAFAQAIQHVPDNNSATWAAAIMGAYYPQTAFCSLVTLARRGPAACFASPS